MRSISMHINWVVLDSDWLPGVNHRGTDGRGPEDLKNTGKGNLFVNFGEPDITLLPDGDTLRVKVNGVDVFRPRTGDVTNDGADGIACWFIDTD